MGTDIRSGEEVRNASDEIKKQLIWQADGFASVLPSDKREAVLTLRNDFGLVVGMTGDGVNDAPALSAAQVGIAVEGATDAAKNAADLILTEPGLSPIYGAVLESRRIFARIKSYVVYRVAASIILVLTLSIIIFTHGCAVNSLLVIILALLNDISMIPVAYDKAKATTKPQLPNATKLVLQSVFYGLVLTGFSLIWIYLMDHSKALKNPIDLASCPEPTQGFIWFHLVMVTELAIFSVRAPSFFLKNLPSLALVASVFFTCVISAIIGIFYSKLAVDNMGYIVLYNLGLIFVVDTLKIWFRKLIKDEPGDVIESDELIPVVEAESETAKHMAKQKRYNVHRESVLDPAELNHTIEIVDRKGCFGNFFSELRPTSISTGFVNKRKLHFGTVNAPGSSAAFNAPASGHF